MVDVSIYSESDSEPLVNILKSIQEKYGADLPVDKKSSKDQLMSFLKEVLPDFDSERVYPSNVKKLISWYDILSGYDVAFEVEDEEEGKEEAPQEEIKAADSEDE